MARAPRIPLDPRIAVGSDVILDGAGMAKVVHIEPEPGRVDLAMADGSRRSLFANLERVRLPIDADAARIALAALQAPESSTMTGDDRFARIGEFQRTEPKTVALCHAELMRLYGTPPPLSFSERVLVARLERLVLGELAWVLGAPFDELVARVRPGAVAAQMGDGAGV